MNLIGLKMIGIRAIAFAVSLLLSAIVVSSLPKFKVRRQKYFADAASQGNLARLQLLHMAGANVNSNGYSRAPLFLAAGEGRLAAVRYLLDEGAEVNAPESDGNTALTEAAFFGHGPIVKELLMRGADVNALSTSGTPLDIAISKNNQTIIELLRHYGGKRASELR